jgi:hypothetical protein
VEPRSSRSWEAGKRPRSMESEAKEVRDMKTAEYEILGVHAQDLVTDKGKIIGLRKQKGIEI